MLKTKADVSSSSVECNSPSLNRWYTHTNIITVITNPPLTVHTNFLTDWSGQPRYFIKNDEGYTNCWTEIQKILTFLKQKLSFLSGATGETSDLPGDDDFQPA